MTRRTISGLLFATVSAAALLAAPAPNAGAQDDAQRILTVDHYVRATSTVPAIKGQPAHIYVRERVQAGPALRGGAGPLVLLFVHGAGTPAEVAFDASAPGYSWMAYLAERGFDTFSMDTTGYGRSTRPAPMDDPCNLSAAQQASLVPSLLATPCAPSYPHQLTNIGSDWDDIAAAVDYIRALRGVEKVSLVAWSLGGPRAGGYAAQHPEKVDKLVLLAPAYNRESPDTPPSLPRDGTAFNTQSARDFAANWDRQIGCEAQFEPSVREAVWADMLASDPVGASWGTGVRRAPSTTTWGWNAAMAAKVTAPTLLVSGVHDKQVPPARVRPLLDDLGAASKVLVDLACSSHMAMWERNHLLLFEASYEWLTTGQLGEATNGVVRLGY